MPLLTSLLLMLASPPDADEFTPMFNGKDLSGWKFVNTPRETFFVKEDMIVTTGKPTGFLRTEKQFENFIAEFDWMHLPATQGAVGNSGFFVWADPIPAVGTGYTRGIEVQVLVNLTYRNKKGEITATSQGDLFSIWGATCVPERPHPDGWARCLPSENHCKGERQWNHYRVEADDGVIKLIVNGHFVSSVRRCRPRKGYLALESEGSECRFRNLKIKELPSTHPKPEEIAVLDDAYIALFNGVDLDGWESDHPSGKPDDRSWRVAGEKLVAGAAGSLSSKRRFGSCELIFDWKTPNGSPATECVVSIGGTTRTVKLSKDQPAGSWHRQTLRSEQGLAPAPIEFHASPGLEIMNVYIRELK